MPEIILDSEQTIPAKTITKLKLAAILMRESDSGGVFMARLQLGYMDGDNFVVVRNANVQLTAAEMNTAISNATGLVNFRNIIMNRIKQDYAGKIS
jgi:hypothetical protein